MTIHTCSPICDREHPTSPDPVAEARELLAAATPGPWQFEESGNSECGDGCCWEWWGNRVLGGDSIVVEYDGLCEADADLIAAAPTLLAALADEVERLRPFAIRACECPNDDDPSGCYCPDGFSHDDCPMNHEEADR